MEPAEVEAGTRQRRRQKDGDDGDRDALNQEAVTQERVAPELPLQEERAMLAAELAAPAAPMPSADSVLDAGASEKVDSGAEFLREVEALDRKSSMGAPLLAAVKP